MDIKIMRKGQAISYVNSNIYKKMGIISISSPKFKNPCFKETNNILGIIYLKINDYRKHHLKKIKNPCILTNKDVFKIKKFVDLLKNKIDELIIHCEAGISRSSAIACGISLYLGKDDAWIWKGKYVPNDYIVELFNKVLNLGLTDNDLKKRYSQKKYMPILMNAVIHAFIFIQHIGSLIHKKSS